MPADLFTWRLSIFQGCEESAAIVKKVSVVKVIKTV